MRRIFLLSIIVFLYNNMMGQQSHFIYLQTDNKQPFYLKLDTRLYSSSSSGYLIVPKLTDDDYNLVIGFPKNEWPEQKFSYKIDNKDAGFLIKNFEEKGWGLFNLQTLEVLMPVNTTAAGNVVMQDKNDAFADMLSDVVNDPAIKQTKTIKVEEKPALPVVTADNVVNADTVVTTVVSDQPVADTKFVNSIVKSFEKENDEGLEMQYIDKGSAGGDTISVYIQKDASESTKEESIAVTVDTTLKRVEEKKSVISDTLINVIQGKPVVQTKFLDIDLSNSTDSVTGKAAIAFEKTDSANTGSAIKIGKSSVEVISVDNANCKELAHKEDLTKFRKKMSSAGNIDNMLVVARKFFKAKCYTTEQIRELSNLILGDEDRYRFFDTAYPFVSDNKKFYTLENLLSDQYYINRFRAMVKP